MRRVWAIALLVFGLPAAASEWQVDHEQSRLGFQATQQDGRLEGEFRRWDAAIRFDPERPADGLIEVTIQIASITTGSRQRDVYLPDEAWFFTEHFPSASFRAVGIEPRGDGRFVARGELTLRGVSRPVELPFTWSGTGDVAEAHAETAIDRTRFGVGQGDFADSDVVGRDVRVVVDLVLRR